MLVEAGADVNAVDNSRTPLKLAVLACNLPVVKYLLEHGADVSIADKEGVAPAPRCILSRATLMTAYVRAWCLNLPVRLLNMPAVVCKMCARVCMCLQIGILELLLDRATTSMSSTMTAGLRFTTVCNHPLFVLSLPLFAFFSYALFPVYLDLLSCCVVLLCVQRASRTAQSRHACCCERAPSPTLRPQTRTDSPLYAAFLRMRVTCSLMYAYPSLSVCLCPYRYMAVMHEAMGHELMSTLIHTARMSMSRPRRCRPRHCTTHAWRTCWRYNFFSPLCIYFVWIIDFLLTAVCVCACRRRCC